MRATGETVAVSAPAGIHATFIDVAESPQSVRYFAKVGDRVPIHATSAGRALLAQLPPEERQRLYRKIDFVRYAPPTPDSPEPVAARPGDTAPMAWDQSKP